MRASILVLSQGLMIPNKGHRVGQEHNEDKVQGRLAACMAERIFCVLVNCLREWPLSHLPAFHPGSGSTSRENYGSHLIRLIEGLNELI